MNNTHAPDLDALLGDDTQDPADAFLVQEQDEMDDDEHDQFLHDGAADGDALASAGWGTDEDYQCGGCED